MIDARVKLAPGPRPKMPAEQRRAVMLERVVVIEPLVREPIIHRGQLGTGQIVRRRNGNR